MLFPAYFSTLFKEKCSVSFKQYLTNLRLEYAKKLLEFSDYNIMQICMESGFDDYTNFLRRFKLKYSITPNEYRKKIKSR